MCRASGAAEAAGSEAFDRMSVDNDTLTGADQGPAPIVFTPRERRHRLGRRRNRPPRPRVKKLRLLLVVSSFLGLAVISLLFGVLTSIASDLPQFKSTVQFRSNVDSYLYDDTGQPIGVLAPPTKTAIDKFKDISPNMIHAIVAVEDKRFWSEPGVDVKGLIRAAASDLGGGPREGASTIPEEFIKQVREEEGKGARTVVEKLVEAGMAFQLTHKWSHPEIITQYLDTIYFGNGAIGIESAARVYFGWDHGYNAADPAGEAKSGCGDPDLEDPTRKECASVLYPWEAALLAGMVANPTAFNPLGTGAEQRAAMERRNLVLKNMYQQGYISRHIYNYGRAQPLPTPAEIRQPEEPTAAPYFTSWVRPQIVNALQKEGMSLKQAEYEADYGGLKINLSINLQMQNDAQHVIDDEFPGGGSDQPTASLVAIDNKTGEVRAMVSGDGDYQQSPFNLATLGYRQPGSSFKLFTLAAALSSGEYGPDSDFESEHVTIPFVKHNKNPYKGNAFEADNGTGNFTVRNFGNAYSGSIPLTVATATSDNSVFAQLGMQIGTAKIAEYAQKMGIRSPISRTPAMIIGGLSTGVSALDMAHAYETVATGGYKIYNPILGDVKRGPIGIDSISNCSLCHQSKIVNHPSRQYVLSPEVASTIDELLHGPVDDSYGTGTAAAIPGVDVAGKTGTTSNYVDAWFVGWTPTMTVAVWVGYPNSGKSMATAFQGQPVEGGTYPAIIFHNFMEDAIQVMDAEAEHKTSTTTTTTPTNTEFTPDTSSVSTESNTSAQTTTVATQTAPANTPDTTVQTTPQVQSTPTIANTTPGTSDVTPTVPATTTPPAPSGGSTVGANGGSGL
jgi:penicillin-binding protein 1A